MLFDTSGLTIHLAVDFSCKDKTLRRVYEHVEYFQFKQVVVSALICHLFVIIGGVYYSENYGQRLLTSIQRIVVCVYVFKEKSERA